MQTIMAPHSLFLISANWTHSSFLIFLLQILSELTRTLLPQSLIVPEHTRSGRWHVQDHKSPGVMVWGAIESVLATALPSAASSYNAARSLRRKGQGSNCASSKGIYDCRGTSLQSSMRISQCTHSACTHTRMLLGLLWLNSHIRGGFVFLHPPPACLPPPASAVIVYKGIQPL